MVVVVVVLVAPEDAAADGCVVVTTVSDSDAAADAMLPQDRVTLAECTIEPDTLDSHLPGVAVAPNQRVSGTSREEGAVPYVVRSVRIATGATMVRRALPLDRSINRSRTTGGSLWGSMSPRRRRRKPPLRCRESPGALQIHPHGGRGHGVRDPSGRGATDTVCVTQWVAE